MQFLIDRFSPAELLHIVSIANRYQLLSTEQKRFLIALRMSNTHDGQVFQVDPEKKQKFCRIFSQFLQEMQEGQLCEKPECPICERFNELREDFHGPQQSLEFSLFMEWFQSSTLKYGDVQKPAEPEAAEPKPAISTASIISDRSALVDSYFSEPQGAPAFSPSQLFPQFAEFPEFQGSEPLFTLNESHPLVYHLGALLQMDVDSLPETALRAYADRLQGLCSRLLSNLVAPAAEMASENNDPLVTAG